MLTESEFLLITEYLNLESEKVDEIRKGYDYTITFAGISMNLLDSRVRGLIKKIDKNEIQIDSVLGSNRGRLQKASSLQWDTDISPTQDLDTISTKNLIKLYKLLNLHRFINSSVTEENYDFGTMNLGRTS